MVVMSLPLYRNRPVRAGTIPYYFGLATKAVKRNSGALLGAGASAAYDSYKRSKLSHPVLQAARGTMRVTRRYRRRGNFRRRSVRRGSGLTSNNYNSKRNYTKGRMPKRMRNKRRRYVRKINNVIDRRLGKNNYNFLQDYTNSRAVGANNAQGWDSVSVYTTKNNSGPSTERDLWTMFYDQASSEGAGAINVIPDSYKLTILGCNLEIMLQNPNTTGNTLEVEVYECIPKKNVGDPGSANNFSQSFLNDFTDTDIVSAGSIAKSKLTGFENRTTPFDNKSWCTEFTVLNSRRYLLPPQVCATYQWRTTKHKYLNWGRVNGSTYNPGISTMFLIRYMPIGQVQATVQSNVLGISWRKSYQITRLEENTATQQKI